MRRHPVYFDARTGASVSCLPAQSRPITGVMLGVEISAVTAKAFAAAANEVHEWREYLSRVDVSSLHPHC